MCKISEDIPFFFTVWKLTYKYSVDIQVFLNEIN